LIGRLLQAISAAVNTFWVWTMLCALLIAAVLWTLGPMIAFNGNALLENVTTRLVAVTIIVFAWGLLVAIRSSRQRRREMANPEIAAKREQEAAGRSHYRDESAHIRDRMKAAIRIVTQSSFYGSSSRSRYALPWYMVMGTPDCGKTSLLLNSGLQFPLNEQADRHLYKLKSTERCEILYANQAVFVDTPGTYLQSIPDSRNHELWKRLLRRLFRVRPAKALNGIIICVSMRDMMEFDAARREHLARTIRSRLSEALGILRAYVPVYLVLTKCDAVPGFAEYFAHLSRSEREQIFGCPAQANELAADSIRKELKGLMQSLNAQLIGKIHQERDCLSRGEMFRFPQELAALGPRLEDFIFEAFGPTRYHRAVMFRGFFFTSALSPGDIYAANAEEALIYKSGFQPSLGDYARGFFLLRLFEDFIIPEAGMAGADKEQIWLLLLNRYGVQVAGFALLAVIVALFGLSFRNNASRIESLDAAYQDLQALQRQNQGRVDIREILPELALLERAMGVYSPETDSAIAYGMGLYRGRDVLAKTRSAYLGMLDNRFLPLVRGMAIQAIEESSNDIAGLRNSLRAYLMLCEPERVQAEFLKGWLERQWSARYLGQGEEQRLMMAHMEYLLASGFTPATPNAQTVEKARTAILKMPLAQLAYSRMMEDASDNAHPPYTFRGALGGQMSPFSGDTYSIPFLYTRAGYLEYCLKRGSDIIRGLTEDDWILGPSSRTLSNLDEEKVFKDLRRMYFTDYADHWRKAVNSLQVRTPESIAQAVNAADQLTSGIPPVVMVLREIRKNTTFSIDPDSRQEKVVDAIGGQALKAGTRKVGASGGEMVKSAVDSAGDFMSEARSAAEMQRDGQVVRLAFKPLDGHLDQEGMPNPPLKAAHDSMMRVEEYFRKLQSSDKRTSAIISALKDISEGRDDTLRNMESAAEKLPYPLKDWYTSVTAGGIKDMLTAAASAINSEYVTVIRNPYEVQFASYFPFNKNVEKDANILQFTEFFKLGGVLDSFTTTYIDPFMTKDGNLIEIMGRRLPISTKSVAQIRDVKKIRNAFFISGNTLGFRCAIEPYALDPTIQKADLLLGTKTLSYWHGPVQRVTFFWPVDSSSQTHQASLAVTDLHAVKAFTRMRGEWALFRLIYESKIIHHDGNTFLVEMQKNQKWVQFVVTCETNVNPFDPATCALKLPESLI
jgi:type VI secretion system protein ImpL